MKRKYFFFDIDGTLVVGRPGGDQYIPKSAREAIQELEKRGHFCSIATGRSYAMAKDVCVNLGFSNMVSDGGNGVTINHKLLGIEPLDKAECIKLIEECNEKGYSWALSYESSKIRVSPNDEFLKLVGDCFMVTLTDPDLDIYGLKEIHKVYIACSREDEANIDMLKSLPSARYHEEYIFVEPDDKSDGIRKIMDHFEAPYEDVVVFGDAGNDLKMFRKEWTSIAMGNAIDELKEKADFVTKDADQDGIAYALKSFGWID